MSSSSLVSPSDPVSSDVDTGPSDGEGNEDPCLFPKRFGTKIPHFEKFVRTLRQRLVPKFVRIPRVTSPYFPDLSGLFELTINKIVKNRKKKIVKFFSEPLLWWF